ITVASPDIVPGTRHNEGVLEMTEPQVWVLIALFAGMLATVSGLVVRVVRSEIGGLRSEMRAELGGLRGDERTVRNRGRAIRSGRGADGRPIRSPRPRRGRTE